MKLVKVTNKIYLPTKKIHYTVKYFRSNKTIEFLSENDCFDLDEVLIAVSFSVGKDLRHLYDVDNSLYLLKDKLLIIKTYYNENN